MRRNDRVILLVLPLLALAAAFWFLLISPKRDEATQLQADIDASAAALEAAESQIAVAEDARDAFPKNYGELVKLGRAVPEDDDQSTLVYDMAEMGDKNQLDFRSFIVAPGSGETPPTPAPEPTASAADESEARVDAAAAEPTAVATPAPPTEAAAATLPIGATIGPAGLPVTSYEFKYTGNFFDVAHFLEDVDDRVKTQDGRPVVHGRLMTVDGFALVGDQFTGFPTIEANFAITTYIVPPGEGITGGATPAGPAPAAAGTPTPVSASTTTTPTPAATATPAP
jgi:hypothetical protein